MACRVLPPCPAIRPIARLHVPRRNNRSTEREQHQTTSGRTNKAASAGGVSCWAKFLESWGCVLKRERTRTSPDTAREAALPRQKETAAGSVGRAVGRVWALSRDTRAHFVNELHTRLAEKLPRISRPRAATTVVRLVSMNGGSSRARRIVPEVVSR